MSLKQDLKTLSNELEAYKANENVRKIQETITKFLKYLREGCPQIIVSFEWLEWWDWGLFGRDNREHIGSAARTHLLTFKSVCAKHGITFNERQAKETYMGEVTKCTAWHTISYYR